MTHDRNTWIARRAKALSEAYRWSLETTTVVATEEWDAGEAYATKARILRKGWDFAVGTLNSFQACDTRTILEWLDTGFRQADVVEISEQYTDTIISTETVAAMRTWLESDD